MASLQFSYQQMVRPAPHCGGAVRSGSLGAAPFSVGPGATVTLGEGVAPELAALDVQHANLYYLPAIFYSVLLPPQINACFSKSQTASWPAFIIYKCSVLNLGSPD